MKDQLITFRTAVLAKIKGFVHAYEFYNTEGKLKDFGMIGGWIDAGKDEYAAPTQALLQKWIRETRGVHIEIHRNASGYYWSMCKSDGGTNLGCADLIGPDPGGTWNTFEEALEDALQVQLCFDLPEDTSVIKHWSNYVDRAIAIRNNAKVKAFVYNQFGF